jgi:type IV pilus assembly protein PilE
MIVVAVVAILSAVAMPSYFDYVRRGQLPEAQAALSDFRVKMEQYYQDNRSYGTTDCADTSRPAWATNTPTLTYGAEKYFTYTCALSGGQAYTVTATGKSGTRANGHIYTIDESNRPKTTRFKDVAVTNRNCWLIKGSECS